MNAHRADPCSTQALVEMAARVSGRCANVARFGSREHRYRVACELALIENELDAIEPFIEAAARATIAEMRHPKALPPARRAS